MIRILFEHSSRLGLERSRSSKNQLGSTRGNALVVKMEMLSLKSR